ncbi:MAG TPA: ABC transporter transmembrane domain-containing protein, partial [Steroidobacteraceae bacterium]|nr:ABC transporter transmembrane domain-containing protein [Steroidobacteraceae bacterium]
MSESTSARPKGRSLQPLKALWPFLRPYGGTLALATVALLVASAAMLALPVAVRYLIDHGMAEGNSGTVNRYFLAFLGAAIVFGVFAALRFYLVTWLGERVVADVRSAVYSRVVRMDMTFFEVTRTGEILSRLTTDTTLVQSISGVGISITLRSALNLFGALVMMGATSPR